MGNLMKLVLSLSVSGGALVAALLIGRPLFRRHFSQKWQYYIWLVILLRLMVPFSPAPGPVGGLFEKLPAQNVQTAQTQNPRTPQVSVGASATGAAVQAYPNSNGVPSSVSAPAPESRPAVDPWGLAGMIWLGAAALLLMLKIVSYLRFNAGIRKNARQVPNGPAAELLGRTAAELGLKKAPRLYLSESISSPMLMGVADPAVFLTGQALSMDAGSLRYVFLHELTHLKRRDLVYKWLAELAVCVHWFNPLAYLMRNRIDALCELSCDEAVAKAFGPDARKAYGCTLLQLSGGAGRRRSLPAATLCEDRAGLKERLISIMKAGKRSKKTAAVSIAAAACLVMAAALLGSCAAISAAPQSPAVSSPPPSESASPSPSAQPTPEASPEADGPEQQVRDLVEGFGQALRNVSLTAPAEDVKNSIKDSYTSFVTADLLEKWLAAPDTAPGRETSSPWPDRIEILSLEKLSEEEYTVNGQIIEITSVEAESGAAAAVRPVSLKVGKTGGQWLISSVTLGEYFARGPVVYENTKYGFDFYLPESWKGYSVLEQSWKGTILDNAAAPGETGPELLIRHPDWTGANPRQDIPVMIFTKGQWDLVEKEEMAVSAAPIGPSKLGENDTYVFALPARYNFAFPTGYEEVQQIMDGNPLWPTKPG